MRSQHIWSRLFLVAGAFNLAVALGMGLFRPGAWGWLQMDAVAGDRLAADLLHAMIGLFGLIYWWIALAPRARRSYMVWGALGKLAVVKIVAWHWFFVGDASVRLVLLVGGDLLFAGLFLWAFWQSGEPA